MQRMDDHNNDKTWSSVHAHSSNSKMPVKKMNEERGQRTNRQRTFFEEKVKNRNTVASWFTVVEVSLALSVEIGEERWLITSVTLCLFEFCQVKREMNKRSGSLSDSHAHPNTAYTLPPDPQIIGPCNRLTKAVLLHVLLGQTRKLDLRCHLYTWYIMYVYVLDWIPVWVLVWIRFDLEFLDFTLSSLAKTHNHY